MTYIPNEKLSITSAIGINSDNVISGGNWTLDTYTGSGEENDYAYVGVNLQVDEIGTLFFDFSQDGVNWSTYPLGGFDIASGINEVHTAWKGGRFMRPRFVGTGGRTFFRLKTYYSNLPLPLSAPLNQSIVSDQDAQVVRAVHVGEDINGNYNNIPSSSTDNNNTTTTPLGISGVFTGNWSFVEPYGEIKVSVVTDVPSANCFLQLSNDGVNVQTSLDLPPQLVAGKYRFIHSLNPSLPYFRIVYINGAAAQSELMVHTTLLVQSGNGFTGRATQILDRYTDVKIVRAVNDPVIDRNLGLINYQEAKRKFGINDAIGTANFEDIWAEGGSYPFIATPTTVRIQAGGDANDTALGSGAREITIEGLDQNWNEVTETLSTNGTLASAPTTTTFIRINRAYVTACGSFGGNNEGIIRIEDSAAVLGVLAHIPLGLGTTFQSIVAVPEGKSIYITKINISVGESDSADVRLWALGDGNLPSPCKRYESITTDYSGFQPQKLETYLKFDSRETIGFDAIRITGQGDARVAVEFEYVLIDNN